jgi:hypothetical protein
LIWLVTTLALKERARTSRADFEAWLRQRVEWYYGRIPLVQLVRAFVYEIGPSYRIQLWVAFENFAALAEYKDTQRRLREVSSQEKVRGQQEEWWEFIDSTVMSEIDTAYVGESSQG